MPMSEAFYAGMNKRLKTMPDDNAHSFCKQSTTKQGEAV